MSNERIKLHGTEWKNLSEDQRSETLVGYEFLIDNTIKIEEGINGLIDQTEILDQKIDTVADNTSNIIDNAIEQVEGFVNTKVELINTEINDVRNDLLDLDDKANQINSFANQINNDVGNITTAISGLDTRITNNHNYIDLTSNSLVGTRSELETLRNDFNTKVIGTNDIMNSAVTAPKIATGAINQWHIQNGVIANNHLSEQTINFITTLAELPPTLIPRIENLETRQIQDHNIADGAVTTDKLADGAVTDNKIQFGTIALDHLNSSVANMINSSQFTPLENGADFNDIPSNQLFVLNGTYSNSPIDDYIRGRLIAYNNSSIAGAEDPTIIVSITQILIVDSNIYIRNFKDDVWASWRKLGEGEGGGQNNGIPIFPSNDLHDRSVPAGFYRVTDTPLLNAPNQYMYGFVFKISAENPHKENDYIALQLIYFDTRAGSFDLGIYKQHLFSYGVYPDNIPTYSKWMRIDKDPIQQFPTQNLNHSVPDGIYYFNGSVSNSPILPFGTSDYSKYTGGRIDVFQIIDFTEEQGIVTSYTKTVQMVYYAGGTGNSYQLHNALEIYWRRGSLRSDGSMEWEIWRTYGKDRIQFPTTDLNTNIGRMFPSGTRFSLDGTSFTNSPSGSASAYPKGILEHYYYIINYFPTNNPSGYNLTFIQIFTGSTSAAVTSSNTNTGMWFRSGYVFASATTDLYKNAITWGAWTKM